MKTLDVQTLAFYLGCECKVDNSIGTIESVEVNGAVTIWFAESHPDYGKALSLLPGAGGEPAIKLVLRPLASMTEEEAKELFKHEYVEVQIFL